MKNDNGLATILSGDLRNVSGGFDAGKCAADTTAGFAAGAATTGGGKLKRAIGGAIWGAEAAATSSNCGDGTRSPAAMAADGIKSSLQGNATTDEWAGAYQSQY